MAQAPETGFDVGHPAPDRGRVSGAALLFGLAGAALAWSLQITATASLAGAACVVGDGPNSEILEREWAQPAAIAVNLLALLASFAALAISYRNLRRTHELEAQDFGGMIDAGEGRTRFMSLWGIFASILFILAIGFNTISVLWVGLCGA